MQKIPLYIDFDRVLFDTDTLKKILCNYFEGLGYEPEKVIEGYKQAGLDRMYTPEKHITALKVMQPELPVDAEAVVQEAYGCISDMSYPGTIDFLQSLNRQAYSPMLLTLGNPGFQQAKAEAAGILPYLDTCYWCEEEKWDYLHKLHQPNDLFVSIDDRGDAITIISQQFPNSFGIFKDVYEKYPHYQAEKSIRVVTFEEILTVPLPSPYASLKDPALSEPTHQG